MDQTQNPCQLDGFAFLEFSSLDKKVLENQFQQMGFKQTAAHKTADISLYQQGNIQFIINAAADCQAAIHAQTHGSGACAMGFKVKDAHKAYDYALKHGAKSFQDCSQANHHLPAIQAIGGSVIYFVDDSHQPFAEDWQFSDQSTSTVSAELVEIDHLTHNVYRGNMDKWAKFYADIFNFREIRFFNIEGQMTGLTSRALSSSCGKIKIPLNESKDDNSQIEEFLNDYKGEGIQHIALHTDNIYHSVQQLRTNGVSFLDVPNTYYEMIEQRVPWHNESVDRLDQLKILIDGEKDPAKELLTTE